MDARAEAEMAKDDNPAGPDAKGRQMQIQMDDPVAQGAYVNLTLVNHTETEFVLDFIFVQPHQPRAKVRSRVICSPKHAKRMLLAMQENMRRYEDRWGVVEAAPMPPGQIH
jgi:hypothetical protein